jgi:hypothetical protein
MNYASFEYEFQPGDIVAFKHDPSEKCVVSKVSAVIYSNGSYPQIVVTYAVRRWNGRVNTVSSLELVAYTPEVPKENTQTESFNVPVDNNN